MSLPRLLTGNMAWTTMHPPEPPRTVAILHEETILRQALSGLISGMAVYKVHADVGDVPALKRAFALGNAPDALVLSLAHACEAQGAVAQWMRKHLPSTRLVALGAEPGLQTLIELFRSGFHGFCNSRNDLDRLRTVLTHVCAGALDFPQEVHAAICSMLAPVQLLADNKQHKDTHVALMRILKRGDSPTYEVAAKDMRISIHTIYKYVDEIGKRYGVKGKGGVIKLAVQMGL